MRASRLDIPEVIVLQPDVFDDDRGSFQVAYNKERFDEITGMNVNFLQDNHSTSSRSVLRGLHYQMEHPQGKLVRVIEGEIYDVAVDIRRSSPSFGQWVAQTISAESRKQMWIPRGFAHGFLVTSDVAQVIYKVDNIYHPEGERSIRWDDADLAIDWPTTGDLIISPKDAEGVVFTEADTFE